MRVCTCLVFIHIYIYNTSLQSTFPRKEEEERGGKRRRRKKKQVEGARVYKLFKRNV